MGLRDRAARIQYQREYRQGLRRPRQVVEAAVRLLNKTDREYGQPNHDRPELGPCWEWQGARNIRGYGVINVDGKIVLAHRLALSIALGRPLAADKVVAHACDNPPCVRPRHLREAEQVENVAEMYARGRWSRRDEVST